MRPTCRLLAALSLTALAAASAGAQVGRTAGMIDPNLATEAELTAVPHITPAIAKAIIDKRPLLRQADFNAVLAGAGLGKEQLAQVYGKAFVHLDLNTASDAEILMIPNIGNRMLREFKEYRPYKAIEQFRREIGKYVKPGEVARLERYITLQ